MPLDSRNLYEALGIDEKATQAEIRKAYLKLAVALHPDKNLNDEEATRRFQTLQKLYSILGNPERRKVYDETGLVEDVEGLSGDSFTELYEYYRNLYVKVTEDDISQFQEKYRGSSEEQRDLLHYYGKFQGDMCKVFQWVICSNPKQDSHRFMDILDAAITQKSISRYENYITWAKQIRKRARPVNSACSMKKDARMPSNDMALVAKIRNKQQSAFGNVISKLADKYVKSRKAESADCEPTEEEFTAARKRLQEHENKAIAKGKRAKRARVKS